MFRYGNPHSRTHSFGLKVLFDEFNGSSSSPLVVTGWESEEAVETARESIADLINANPKEIIFTSGATEANNIALKGVSRFYKKKKNHIITTQIDHKCVLDACRALEQVRRDVNPFHPLPCRRGLRLPISPYRRMD